MYINTIAFRTYMQLFSQNFLHNSSGFPQIMNNLLTSICHLMINKINLLLLKKKPPRYVMSTRWEEKMKNELGLVLT